MIASVKSSGAPEELNQVVRRLCKRLHSLAHCAFDLGSPAHAAKIGYDQRHRYPVLIMLLVRCFGCHAGLLRAGGAMTSLVESGQQWDAPNAWPPLQALLIEGLVTYGGTVSHGAS